MYSANDDFFIGNGNTAEEQWRGEVTSRLAHYRARRKKKVPENALQFDFEQAEQNPEPQSQTAKALTAKYQSSNLTCDTNYYRKLNAEAASAFLPPFAEPAPEAIAQTVTVNDYATTPEEAPSSAFPGASAAPAMDPDFDFDRPREFPAENPPAARADDNLIYFPKLNSGFDTSSKSCLGPQPGIPILHPSKPNTGFPGAPIRLPVEPPTVQPRPRGELAEPVSTPPRILDVPEEIIPTIQGPLFAEISLDADKSQSEAADLPSTQPIELPLQAALLSQRFFAALVDGLIVLAGTIIFCGGLWKMLPEMPHGRSAVAALGSVLIFVWTLYHYFLLVYGGRTAGMEIANISLRSFNGHLPGWKQRKWRVYSMLFSLVSMGLGFLWALVDEDCLCWHDRMTRTFLTSDRP